MSEGEQELVRLTDLDNEVEAQAIADMLKSEDIQHAIKPHGVSLYPGVRTGRGAWGEAWVREDQLDQAKKLLEEVRSVSVGDDELEQQAMHAAPAGPPKRKRDDRAVALVISLTLSVLLLWLLWQGW
jgi:hypothetical protein